MPSANQILDALSRVANDYFILAVIWHGVFYFLLLAIILKWRPTERLLSLFLVLPLATVAILAWFSGNPFNGMTFSAATILAGYFSLRTAKVPVKTAPLTFFGTGIAMLLFGLWYPHFIESGSWFTYLYAAPSGLIPCPTLSVLIGFALMFRGFHSKGITITLIVFGLFYSLFGMLKLGVILDLGLLLGTLILALQFVIRNCICPTG